jgi:Flp pilus assembly protein TadD
MSYPTSSRGLRRSPLSRRIGTRVAYGYPMPVRRPSLHDPEETREASLRRRAVRFRRRGDDRAAMLALRQAALENEEDASLWTLYGVQCARLGRVEEAERALSHAAWLRDRRKEPGKARTTRAILRRLMGDRAA